MSQLLASSRDVWGPVAFGLTGLAVYVRLFFGVDFTDESFYVALPYGFSLGHRPLVDEHSIHQLAGLMLQPAVESYRLAVGSNEGLVLFTRHLYFAISLGCALLVRGFLVPLFGARSANLVAAVSLAYVPFHIPSLSYNTIAYLGLLAGTMLFASACLPGRRPTRLFFATLCMVAATFAYPVIFLATGAGVLLGLAGFRAVRERDLWSRALALVVLAGLGSLAAGLSVLASYGGTAELARLVELNEVSAIQGGGLAKLNRLTWEIRKEGPYLAALTVILGSVLACYRWLPSRAVAGSVCGLLGPALACIATLYQPYTEPYTTAPFALTIAGLAAPAAIVAVRRELPRAHWVGLAIIAVPSLLTGGTMLWASANGLRNATLGLLPAALVSLASLSRLRAGRPAQAGGGGSGLGPNPRSLCFALLVSSLLGFQLFGLWTQSYRDASPSRLVAFVRQGAWMGIRTTAARRRFIETFEADLQRVRADAETIVFYDYFPGGYLMSDLRPRTPTVWLFPSDRGLLGNRSIRRVYARSFSDAETLPDLVVRMSCVPTRELWNLEAPPDDPVVARLSGVSYRTLVERRCYEISRKVSEQAAGAP